MTEKKHKKSKWYPGNKHITIQGIIAIQVVAIIVLGYFIWRDGTIGSLIKPAITKITGDKKIIENILTKPGVSTPTPTPTPKSPTPTPTPTRLLSGKETYYISQTDKTKALAISSLILDPLDVKKEDKQTLIVKVVSDVAVQSVSIEFQSDTKKRTLTLTLGEGAPTSGDWKTTWTLDDSVLYKYILTITATDANSKSTAIVAPRS